jgi:hypothetical protein
LRVAGRLSSALFRLRRSGVDWRESHDGEWLDFLWRAFCPRFADTRLHRRGVFAARKRRHIYIYVTHYVDAPSAAASRVPAVACAWC